MPNPFDLNAALSLSVDRFLMKSKLKWFHELTVLSVFFSLSAVSLAQPGKPLAVAISTHEKIFENEKKSDDYEIAVYSFNNLSEYEALQNFQSTTPKIYWQRDRYGIFDDVMVYLVSLEFPGGPRKYLEKGSFIEVSFRDTTNMNDGSSAEIMRIYIRLTSHPRWDYQIQMMHLDSFYNGDFFYDMCHSNTYPSCVDGDDGSIPFPQLYNEKGNLRWSDHQELNLSCIEDYRIEEGSILEVIENTNCED